MAMPISARFIAAAVLSGILAAPQALALGGDGQPAASFQLADNEAGKAGQAGKEGKKAAGQAGGNQTARKPAQSRGGDEGGYGVERPAPEGGDPNAGDGDNEAAGGDGETKGEDVVPPGTE